MRFLGILDPVLYSFCLNVKSQRLTPDFAGVPSSWNAAWCTYWKGMCIHRTWFGTGFAGRNDAPLVLFNLPLQINSHLGIKRNMLCTLAGISILSAAGSLKEVKHLVVQSAAPCFGLLGAQLHLAALRHPRWQMFSWAEGVACSCVLSRLGISCLAVEICSLCSTGLNVHQSVFSGGIIRSITLRLTHVLKAITGSLLSPQHLP